MKVTIRDIAKAAGVSASTVSNAFSGNNRIGEMTRLRVLEIARQMGYKDMSRPMLKKGIHFVIFRRHGRVVIDSPFFSELITGIESACRRHGYEFTISYAYQGDAQLMRDILSDNTHPMLLLATEMAADDIRPFLKLTTPLVVLDSQFMDIGFSSVHIDNVKAGYIAAQHFMEKGHRTFGLIASSIPFNNVRDRQLGFEMALREQGFELEQDNIFAVDPTIEGAYEDMAALLTRRREQMPSALFAFNDLMAAGAMRALIQAGLRVPEDVSLIGMDNLPAAAMLNPPLTSVHVPKFDMGGVAVEQLIRMAEDPDQPVVHTAVDVVIVERDSVGEVTNAARSSCDN